MRVILVALVVGCLIGCLLDRLASCFIRFIHEKEACTGIGAITCAPVRQTSLVGQFPKNGVSGLLQKYLQPFLEGGYSKSPAGKTIVLMSSVFSGLVVWHFGVTFAGLAALLCLYFLILLGFVDSGTGYLPDCLTYSFLWAGLLVNIKATFVTLHVGVISALSAYLVCLMANAVFRCVTGKDGMGNGDFKMIAGLGAWFGWRCLAFIVIMASFLAIAAGLIRMFSGRARFEEYFPFGPYLAIATLPILLYGRILMQTLNDFS